MKRNSVMNVQPMIIKDPVVMILIVFLVLLGGLHFINPLHMNGQILELVEKGFQLILSCAVGSFIGLEREVKRHPAGLRTYALVCLGSTLIMVVSFGIFEDYGHLANFDPARLGAQVVSGIGFLGAGTIIHNKTSVKGLTSAAGLWVVASIGLAIGAKMYVEALGYFFVVFFTLHYFNNVERRAIMEQKVMRYKIFAVESTFLIAQIGNVFGNRKVKILSIDVEREEDDYDSEVESESHKLIELRQNQEAKDVSIVVHGRVPVGYEAKSMKKAIRAIEGVKYVSTKEMIGGNYEADWT